MHFPLCPYPPYLRHCPSLNPSILSFFFFFFQQFFAPQWISSEFFSTLGKGRVDSSCAFAQDSSGLWQPVGTVLSEMEDVALPGAEGARRERSQEHSQPRGSGSALFAPGSMSSPARGAAEEMCSRRYEAEHISIPGATDTATAAAWFKQS